MRSLSTAFKWFALIALPVLLLMLIGVSPAHATVAARAVAHALPHSYLALPFIGAIGKESDMIIYQEEYQSGLVEGIAQFLAIFNEGTRGAIQLIPNALKGDYSRAAFFKDIAALVSRRDVTSTTAATVLPMTQDEVIAIKINRKIGPVGQTLDAMKKAGLYDADASRAFGVFAANHKMKDMVNTALIAGETAIQSVAANNLDITGESTKTASTSALQRALSKLGDKAQDIVCWVAHSKVNSDIMLALMSSNVTGLTDVATIQGAIPGYVGRPQIITDSPSLTDANGSATDTYNTLGLVAGGIVVEESEDETFFTQVIGGAEQLYRLFQAEYAYNVTVKGFKWNTGAGANPSDATLGTTSSWTQVASDTKLLAGVRLVTQ